MSLLIFFYYDMHLPSCFLIFYFFKLGPTGEYLL